MILNFKVAIISSQAFSLLNFRKEVIQEIINRGAKVYVLAPDFNDNDKNILREFGAIPVDIKLKRLSIGVARSIIDVYNLFKVLNKIKPSTTLSYFAQPVILGNIAAFFAGVNNRFSIIEGLGNSNIKIERSIFFRIIFLISYKVALHKSIKVFFTNKEDELFFLDNRLLKKDQSVLWGGIGVDLKFWECSRNFDEKKKKISFIMSTRLLKSKGVLIYLKAAEKIKNQFPHTNFVLVGGLDDNPDSLKLDDLSYYTNKAIVEWPGHVNNVKQWLFDSDIFILPSYYGEGVPRSIQEAMSCSMPIITTDWVGCRETVKDGLNGQLIPIRDVESLCDAMSFYVLNQKFIKSHGLMSRKIAKENFNVHKKSNFIADYVCK